MADDQNDYYDNAAAYELSEPFDIDHGELDECSRQECFCLGVEWAYVARCLDTGRAFERPVHIDNAERIEMMCQRRGREYSIETMPEDETWAWLNVKAM